MFKFELEKVEIDAITRTINIINFHRNQAVVLRITRQNPNILVMLVGTSERNKSDGQSELMVIVLAGTDA